MDQAVKRFLLVPILLLLGSSPAHADKCYELFLEKMPDGKKWINAATVHQVIADGGKSFICHKAIDDTDGESYSWNIYECGTFSLRYRENQGRWYLIDKNSKLFLMTAAHEHCECIEGINVSRASKSCVQKITHEFISIELLHKYSYTMVDKDRPQL